MATNIVSVKYEDNFEPKVFGGKQYCYYSALPLQIGDLVVAPTASGDKIAMVSEINIDEWKIENIKSLLKTIESKVDRDKYLDEDTVLLEVA